MQASGVAPGKGFPKPPPGRGSRCRDQPGQAGAHDPHIRPPPLDQTSAPRAQPCRVRKAWRAGWETPGGCVTLRGRAMLIVRLESLRALHYTAGELVVRAAVHRRPETGHAFIIHRRWRLRLAGGLGRRDTVP
jgi:hypothetical protein